jgi:plasmid stability protein
MTALQIRNVPDELLDRLKVKAAARRQSLSEYALSELEAAVERKTLAEVRAEIAKEEPIAGSVDAAAIIRELRDSQ